MHRNYSVHQANKKDMQQFRAASGLCVACGKISKTYRCLPCALTHAENQKAYRKRKREEPCLTTG